MHERRVREVIKKVDNMRNLEEYMQHKNEEKWEHVDAKAKNSFAKITTSKVKITAGMNMHGERIKIIRNNNKYEDLSVLKAEDTWEHKIMCNKNTQTIDEHVQNMKSKFKVIIKSATRRIKRRR